MLPDAEYCRRVVEANWLATKGRPLHQATLTDGQLQDIADDGRVEGPVRPSCGRTASSVSVPGALTRMGARRCTGCCRARGLPDGAGSPRNDQVCRQRLGLPG